jgi:hypothetical protein
MWSRTLENGQAKGCAVNLRHCLRPALFPQPARSHLDRPAEGRWVLRDPEGNVLDTYQQLGWAESTSNGLSRFTRDERAVLSELPRRLPIEFETAQR